MYVVFKSHSLTMSLKQSENLNISLILNIFYVYDLIMPSPIKPKISMNAYKIKTRFT